MDCTGSGFLSDQRVTALVHDATPVQSLIAFLRNQGYRTTAFLETIEAQSQTDLLSRTVLYALMFGEEFSCSDDPLQRILALFTFGADLSKSAYETAFPREIREPLERSGIVVRSANNAVRATVTIVEHMGLFMVADRLFELHGGEVHMVTRPLAMPPHLSTFRTFDALCRFSPAESLLDVGTGPGSIALFAGSTYKAVTGIDVQPRAIALAKLNAVLNGYGHLQFVLADGAVFDDGRTYDRVVFNSPGPFEIADGLARRAWNLLAPDGVCIILAWLHLPNDSTAEAFLAHHLRRWPGVRVDAHLFPESPFSAGAGEIESGVPRIGSFLTPQYVAALRREGVRQRVEAVLTLQPSRAPALTSIADSDVSWSGGLLESAIAGHTMQRRSDGLRSTVEPST